MREACDGVEDMAGADKLGTVAAWIHTHPRLSVFLSGKAPIGTRSKYSGKVWIPELERLWSMCLPPISSDSWEFSMVTASR